MNGSLPKLKSISTAGHEVGIVVVFMLVDSEVPSTDLLHPFGSALTRSQRLQVIGVQGGNANLGDNSSVALVSFDIDADENHGSLVQIWSSLIGFEHG